MFTKHSEWGQNTFPFLFQVHSKGEKANCVCCLELFAYLSRMFRLIAFFVIVFLNHTSDATTLSTSIHEQTQ